MTLIKKYPVLTYYILVFVISWGGFMLVGGTGLFAGSSWQTDPLFLNAVTALLAGPPVAGFLLTILVSGREGLSNLLARLLNWRVGVRWYAAALLIAPLLQAAVLLLLTILSSDFLPAIFTTGDKASLLQSSITIGLVGALMEELGWTGFAIPRLRLRHGVFTTGVIVGVLWGVWHLPQMLWVGITSADKIPLVLFLSQYFLLAIATLTAYRVLMVWVYDRTKGSMLVAVLMHGSYIFSTLFVFAPPTTGWAYLTYSWIFTAALWIVVAVIQMSKEELYSDKPEEAGSDFISK